MKWRKLPKRLSFRKQYGVNYTPKDYLQIRWGYISWQWEYQ